MIEQGRGYGSTITWLRWTARQYSSTLASWVLRHRVEAQGFALQFRSFAALDQEQKSECASGETRGGGGLGPMVPRKSETFELAEYQWHPMTIIRVQRRRLGLVP
jgi:hypothetical protein